MTQSISDWATGTAGSTLSGNAGQSVAVTTAYRDTSPGGTNSSAGPFNAYGYSIAVDSTRTVESITLPDDGDVKVLSIATAPVTTPANSATLAATAASGASADLFQHGLDQ